jgi:hypothetical protein
MIIRAISFSYIRSWSFGIMRSLLNGWGMSIHRIRNFRANCWSENRVISINKNSKNWSKNI